MFDIPKQGEPLPEEKPVKTAKAKAQKVKRAYDPRLVTAARELRDRWLEQVNATPILPAGKYEVTRQIDGAGRVEAGPMKLIQAA